MTLITDMPFYRAAVIKSGLGLMSKGIKPNRQWTKKLALANANEITGKCDKTYEAAIASLQAWIDQRIALKGTTPQGEA